MNNKILIWLLILVASLFAEKKIIHKITIDGVINPVATEYIINSIEKAEDADAELLIIEMDTPGGLMVSMHARNVIFSLKMNNGQRNVKSGAKSIKRAILKSRNMQLKIQNYHFHR